MSAAGESLIPFMVSSRVNNKNIEQWRIDGFRMGVDMRLEHKQRPYITATRFHQYVTTVLTGFVGRLQVNQEFRGKSPILLMDNYSIQTKPEILAILREHNIKISTFPPHTTQVWRY
jgi:hypothetical protein